MKERRYFGTDGIRGRVGIAPITADFVLQLGHAAGRVLAREGATVLIGKDPRISGYMFEAALEAGLSAAGVDVLLTGPMPTPAIAYLTRTLHMAAGVVISASHNPFYDNGIKFFGADGQKLDDAVECAIEAMLAEPLRTVAPEKLGKARRVNDAGGRYIEFCKSTAHHLNLSGLKIVVDCAHGATYQVAPSVFRELGAKVTTIGNTPNGLNINEGVGSTHPQALIDAVKQHQADLGVAFDGDGDRLLMVDRHGRIYDGDDLLYIIALARKEQAIVGTLMSNLGFELALKEQGVILHRAKVGDRYVLEQLKAHQLTVGGENSGHIICMDKLSTGDGVVASLQVLKALQDSGQDLPQAVARLHKFPQVMHSVQIETNQTWQTPTLSRTIADAEQKLAGRGRILIRPSGTEPVVRVMVEGEQEEQVSQLAQQLVDCIKAG